MKVKVLKSTFSHIEKGMTGESELTPEQFAEKNGGALIPVQFRNIRNPTFANLTVKYDPVVCMLKSELEVATE